MTKPLNILYVDDDPDIREIATLSLELDAGLQVRNAGSGEEALALLADADWTPDLILLDAMMAGMDGPAVAAALAARPRFARVPIVFMTARARAGDVAGYHAQGAAGVIAKPFDPTLLAAEIRRLAAAAQEPS